MRTTMATENNNKTLNVPNLRFPEFSGEWEQYRLGNLVEIRSGVSPTGVIDDEGVFPFYKVEQLNNCYINLGTTPYMTNQSVIPANSIVFPKRGAAIMTNKIRISSKPCQIDTNLMALSIISSKEFDYKFIYYFIDLYNLSKIADTSTIPQINNIHINPLKIKIPSICEQKKISDFLSLLDDRIATQIKIIEKLESLIRGLITDVNSGRIAQCESVYLRDLLTERHEKNTNNYEVCSVSVSQGVINQIDYLGRSFAAKEVLHYNVVNCGDIVYTKSPTGEFPYGIVKRSDITKPVAVSPLYGVYHPINDYVGRYLHLYFKNPINAKNYLHKLIQKGAKNTINITNQHFLDNKILIPDKGWLDKVVKFAAAIEMKIATENKVLQTLQQQKDYLLSKMFI